MKVTRTGNKRYEQRDSNSYGIFPLFLKKRLATNFSMFAKVKPTTN